MGIGAYPIKKGLAEELGAIDRFGRGFSLDKRDIGIDVTGYIKEENNEERRRGSLPAGHRFFRDCEREIISRKIEWLISTVKSDAWFVTLTFKDYVGLDLANKLMLVWLNRLEASYLKYKGSGRLNWICATEWQRRSVVHFHLIVLGVGLRHLTRKRWESRWMGTHKLCGFARIYDAEKKAAPYLAKYTSKALEGEIQWCRAWQGLSAPESLSCCKAKLPGHPPTAR